MNLGNLIINLAINLSALQDGLNRASGEIEKWGKKAGEDMKKVGQALSLYVTAPLVAMGTVAGKTAIDFESAFAGVRKTVDATEEQYAQLERGIRDMAKTIPASAAAIASVAEAAGQLGIERENIMGFSRVMIDLGESTNLSSEEAATALARLANITQMPQTEFDKLGSTIVALGNSLATTEAEIVNMGLRLAGAGKQVGMTEAQILGFAGALSSVGIEAEAGGTAFSTVFKRMFTATKTGSAELQTFAQVAGMTTEQFKQQFQVDATGAIVAFIEGLGKIGEQGGNTIGVLKALGMEDIRVSDALLRAAGAGDLFRRSIQTGTDAWEENTALTNEASERYKTLASQLKITRNYLTEVALIFGRDLMPMIRDAAKAVRDFAAGFATLDPLVRQVIIVFGAIAAAIGPVLVLLGSFLTAIAPGGVLAIALGALANPVGLTVVALAGLAAAITAVVAAVKRNTDTTRESADALRDQSKTLNELVGRYDELESKASRTAEEEAERLRILERLEQLSPSLISGYNAQGEALGVNRVALEKYNAELRKKLDLEEQNAKQALLAARERAAAARIEGQKAMQELNALQAKRDEAVKKAEERLARAQANYAKAATVGNRNAVDDAQRYLEGTMAAWDKQINAKKAEMKAVRESIDEATKAYEALKGTPDGGKPTTTAATTTTTDLGGLNEEFNLLKGIELARARHSAGMISDQQYLNALKAEAARLEKLGVTTSEEYLSVRAEISRMAPDQLAEANRQLQLDLERVKLWKTGKAGELKALQEHLGRLQKIGGTELEQLQTQNRIAALQETKVDLAAKLKREHEEELLISAKLGEGLDGQVRLQEAYVEKLKQAVAENRDDLKLRDALLQAEKDLLSVKERQANEQKRIADEAKRAADEAARANKQAFETLRTFAKGFAAAVDTSKVDDLVAKLAAQREFIQRLEAMGAPVEDIEKARKEEANLQVDLQRAQAEHNAALPQFLTDNVGVIAEMPTLLERAATYLSSLVGSLGQLLPIIGAVAAAFALLQRVWAQNAGGIQEAFGNLMIGLQGLWDGITAFFDPLLNIVGSYISTWLNAWSGLFSLLGTALQGIAWIFDKVLRPPLDWVAAAFRLVNNAIIDFVNWIRGFLGKDPLKKAGEGAEERRQEAFAQLEFPKLETDKMATKIGTAVGRALEDVLGSFTSINPLPVEDVARANVFGVGPSSRFFYEKEARVTVDLNVTGEADPASIAKAFEDSGLRALLADTVGGEVSVRALNPRFA